MKIRDSGMPEAQTWETFFDADHILTRLHFAGGAGEVVDFGCGYGTFAIAAARRTSGTVHALDIDPKMVAATAARAASLGLANVKAVECDFERFGSGLPESSMSYAMQFNILHAQDAVGLLREALRVLEPRGALAIVHWVHDPGTPRGPPLSIRPRPEQCVAWASEVGFVVDESPVALPPYHYGLVAHKRP